MPDAGWHEPLQPPTYARDSEGVGWFPANGNGRCDHNPILVPKRGEKYGEHVVASGAAGRFDRLQPAHDMPDPTDTAALEQWLARED